MSSKLVFLDIDGTLADERHEVPISAQEACKAARSRGHKLFICTGRSMPKIERGILDLGLSSFAMYLLLPGGPSGDFVAILVTFIFATLLGFASHSPGGLGVFDAAMLIASGVAYLMRLGQSMRAASGA